MTATLKELQALCIDMDGVLYRGETALPGARAFLAWLTERQFPFLLLTNNSTLDSLSYQQKLAGMGIDVPADQIVTSASATADYLARNYDAQSRVYIIGERGLEDSVAHRGFTITNREPDVVIVGMDRQLCYEKLRIAGLAIRAGAHFIATNPDRTLPTEAGDAPGAGAIVAALVAATDKAPVVIGKPEPAMLELAIARLGRPPQRTAMLGDRLETDILGGQRLSMPTILVLSGVTKSAPPADADIQPTWVFSGLSELLKAWQRSLEA